MPCNYVFMEGKKMRMENRELMETTSKVIAGGQRRAVLPSFLRDSGGKRAARLAACALSQAYGCSEERAPRRRVNILSTSPSDNVVTITDGKVVLNGEPKLVDVTLSGTDIMYVVSSTKADVANNSVTFSGNSEFGVLVAGVTTSGDVHHNSIIVSGGKVVNVAAGATEKGSASYNRVVVNDGEITDQLYAGKGTDKVHHNSIDFTGGTINGLVAAGLSREAATAYENTVNISGGEIGGPVFVGSTSSGRVYNNTVSISGGTINAKVVGGMSDTGKADGNIVRISGGTFTSTSNIYGGFTDKETGTASNNTIENSGTPDLREASLYGCNGNGSGNQLKLHGASTVQIKKVEKFSEISIAGNVGVNAPALKITGTADFTGTKLNASEVNFNAGGLQPNAKLKFIDTTGATVTGTPDVDTQQSQWFGSGAFAGQGHVELVEGSPTYVVDTMQASEQAHAPTMGSTAGAEAVSSAAVSAMDTAMSNLASAPAGETTGFAGFGAGQSKYKTGSDVTTNLWQGTFGAGTKRSSRTAQAWITVHSSSAAGAAIQRITSTL